MLNWRHTLIQYWGQTKESLSMTTLPTQFCILTGMRYLPALVPAGQQASEGPHLKLGTCEDSTFCRSSMAPPDIYLHPCEAALLLRIPDNVNYKHGPPASLALPGLVASPIQMIWVYGHLHFNILQHCQSPSACTLSCARHLASALLHRIASADNSNYW